MQEEQVGDVLYYLRTERGASREQLFQGLCSRGNYSYYEQGQRLPDRLLLNAFLQRLGKNADKLATVLSAEEYEYFQWKKKVLMAVGQEDMETLQRLLSKSEAVRLPVNERLQQQFLAQMQAIVAEHVEKNIGKSVLLLETAAELTMPGIREQGFHLYLISMEEMEIWLNLATALKKAGREAEARELLEKIVKYVEQQYKDYESKVVIYPKAVRQLIPLLIKEKRMLEGRVLCKKAVELLCVQGVLYDLSILMEYYLECCNEEEDGEAIRYEKQLQALQEVYRENGAEHYLKENTAQSYSNREIYLIDEVVKRGRTRKAITQAVLSEQIEIENETMSRIESGKRTPSKKHFRAMMKTLDTELDYYNGELDTTDFLLLEKKLELERAISLKRWKEAYELLEYLKSKLDMRRPRNQRTLRAEENCILFNMGKLDKETFLTECEKAMDCEGERWREESFWNQFLTRYKVRILNYIAILYHIGGQTEKSIFILEHMLAQLVDSKVELADRYKSSMTVIGNLSSYYGEAERLEDCIKTSEMGIELCLESGRGIGLGKLLCNKAEALNDITGAATEMSKCYLKQAYYISDLMSVHRTAAYVDKYYCTCYEQKSGWY